MKKISIITMQNVPNYGSVLQAYATQIFFEDNGLQVEFVDYWRKNMLDEENVRRAVYDDCNLKFQKYWCKSQVVSLLAYHILLTKRKRRNKVFRDFVSENLHVSSKQYIGYESLIENPPAADVYCTGGDQVWNSDWNEGIDKAFFLDYAPSEKLRISFSSSIGKEELSIEEKGLIIPLLRKYNLLTVREKSAKTLLQNEGLLAYQILDPVFLVKKEIWSKFVDADANIYGNDYILVYQLNDDDRFYNYLDLLASGVKKKVVYLKYTKSKVLKNSICINMPEVNEFLKLIYHAKYILTDSFHATAFSIIFNKQFQCIFPAKYNTRIKSILDLLSLEERIVSGNKESIDMMQKKINYDLVERELGYIREKDKQLVHRIINF